jgi:NarL family two-component system sensor histidine kinase LiaS
MKRPRFTPFRGLQWRLTFSYTLVTVAALAAVELIILAALLAFLNSDFLVNTIATTIRDSIAPQARTFLEASPPDLEGLNDWLETLVDSRVVEGQSSPRLTQGLSINLDQVDSYAFVLDPDSQLLGQSPPPQDAAIIGNPFDPGQYPELDRLLPIALSGEMEVEKLIATRADGTLLFALPVIGQEEAVMAVLVMVIPLPAFNLETLGPILGVILYSLIPFTVAAALIGTLFGFLTARGLSRRLRRLARAADAWSQGDFSAGVQDRSGDELGQLGRRLNRMAEQLQNLLQTRQELATLEERNRMARDLHDSVKQQVFATTMQISAARAAMESDPENARRHLKEAEQLSHRSQQELAGLIQELRPAALEGKGLVEALRDFAKDWSRRTQIPAQIRTREERSLPLPVEQALFYVAQEALANVARHSHAGMADVHLAWEDGRLTLTVSDDGSGFEAADGGNSGFGTQIMRERMEAVNGRLEIESQPGQGTRVIARVTPTS